MDKESKVAESQHYKGLGVKGTRDKYGREIPDSSLYTYTYMDWRPTSEKETMLASYENKELGKNSKYKVFVDNPP